MFYIFIYISYYFFSNIIMLINIRVINNQGEISFPSSKTYNIGNLERLEYV